MKDPGKMSHDELIEYVAHLKNMIHQLQSEIKRMIAMIDARDTNHPKP